MSDIKKTNTLSNIYKLSLFLLILSIWGCATTTGTVDIKSEKLPKPGAKVSIGSVTNSSGESFDFDVEKTLHDALVSALKENDIYSDSSTPAADFIISLDIIDYRPGNALKRWLLPGYGSTVLSVRGDLKDITDESLIASIEQKRSVVAGGAYTIGAWQYIFPSIAKDIANNLKVKIEQGGDFVVHMANRADIVPTVKPEISPYTVKVEPIKDKRTEVGRIGWRTAAFGVSMGNIHFFRRVPEYFDEALQNEIHLMGYKIVNAGEDIRISGELHKLWIETDTTALYWDMIGEIQIKLKIDSDRIVLGQVVYDYSCKKTERTYIWPTEELAGKVLDSCLDDIMNQLREEKIWTKK